MISFKWNDVNFNLVQYGRGVFRNDMPGHSHSKNSYELHYIVDGEGLLTTDSKTYPLSEGNFFVTGPNVYHQQSTNPENPLTEIYLYLQVSEKKTNDVIVSSFLNTHFCFLEETYFGYIFDEILTECNGAKFGYISATGALLQLLLTKITRAYMPHISNISKDADTINDRCFFMIEYAFINNPSITLRELAETIGLCERQTQRLLKKYYGKTFREKKKEAVKSKKSLPSV
jgi:hypothetical protein